VTRRPDGEAGVVATPALLLLWVGLLLGVVLVDVGSYLLAATRAQGAADAAALAAVSVDVDGGIAPPLQAARAVTGRNGAELERCDCRAGRAGAEVAVSVEVGGLFIARVTGMQRVEATATAELTDPDLSTDPPAGGPTHPAPDLHAGRTPSQPRHLDIPRS
jgi:Flp pilus assembly protein TadG